MTGRDVLSVLDLADGLGIRTWLDGGWAVDADLGTQTRPHSDLDIVLESHGVDQLVHALRDAGYRPVPRDDTSDWNFVLGNACGHRVDVHVITLDAQGRGGYGPEQRGEFYPAESLLGRGVVAGREVACISPECLVAFHTGYRVDRDDWSDVRALCEKFGIAIPQDYAEFC